ncbi:hypothetical protein PR202_gb21165 [Eleusine coracana subsp. coracana]|uniref:DUF2190 family protein n=1 Tax=Eleusine coracana subsp. coracana TaxID=191504 RepID=A0AAV5FDD6_ELECO|nr:hypothetical protein PR202_gb21165 [Eleusine coracana subsp. coracana]
MAFANIKFRPGDKIFFGTISLVANQHGNLVKHECVAHSNATTTDQSNPAGRFLLGLDNAATAFQAETLLGGQLNVVRNAPIDNLSRFGLHYV